MNKFKKMQKEVKLLLAGARVCAIIAKKMQKSKRQKMPLIPILSGFTRLTLHYFRTIIWCLKKEKRSKKTMRLSIKPILETMVLFRYHAFFFSHLPRGSLPS